LTVALTAVGLLAVYWRVALLARDRVADASGQLWSSELETIWRPFLDGKRPVVISLGTPLFTKFTGGGFFRDPKVNDWEQAQKSARVRELRQTLKSSYASPAYNYTGVGEATGAFLLGRLLFTRRPDLILKRSVTLS
jgi:hypothetical protein